MDAPDQPDWHRARTTERHALGLLDGEGVLRPLTDQSALDLGSDGGSLGLESQPRNALLVRGNPDVAEDPHALNCTANDRLLYDLLGVGWVSIAPCVRQRRTSPLSTTKWPFWVLVRRS